MGDLEKLVLMRIQRREFSTANTVFAASEFNFSTSNRVSSTDVRFRSCTHQEFVRKSMMSSVKNQNILALSQNSSSFSWKTQARHFILRLFLAPAVLSDAKQVTWTLFWF